MQATLTSTLTVSSSSSHTTAACPNGDGEQCSIGSTAAAVQQQLTCIGIVSSSRSGSSVASAVRTCITLANADYSYPNIDGEPQQQHWQQWQRWQQRYSSCSLPHCLMPAHLPHASSPLLMQASVALSQPSNTVLTLQWLFAAAFWSARTAGQRALGIQACSCSLTQPSSAQA
jgi:hypothetical protein